MHTIHRPYADASRPAVLEIHMRHLSTLGIAGLSALALTLSACGSDTLDPGGSTKKSSQTSEPVTVKEDPQLSKLVPDDIRKLGTLTVGTDASYAPGEFTENGNQIKGMDIDLLKAVADKLGLKVRFENGNFDSLIGGVSSGKYPVSISSFTINSDRLKQITMIQYFNAGTSWATQANSTKKIDIKAPCGLTVGVQKGTVQVDELNAKNKECIKAGKPGINQVVEDAQSKVTADLMSGKVDAMTADSPVAAWSIAQSNGSLKPVGSMYDTAPYGIAVSKDNKQFADAIAKALTALHQDGSYKKILQNWGNTAGAVTEFPINPQVG